MCKACSRQKLIVHKLIPLLRDCFYRATASIHKLDFIQAINKSFGSGGMFCTLSDVGLGNYLLQMVIDFMKTTEPKILTAVENVGQQDQDPPVFLLSSKVCYTPMHLAVP